MHTHTLNEWQHDHVFSQDQKRAGEKRTLLVVALTAIMMVIEISAGLIYGSMALLADGLHMASHTVALSVSVFAYVVSRRLAANRRFTFGVGKINSLAGFASAVLLLGFAFAMVTESTNRLINPVTIAFDQALIVAVVGLIVNGVSAWILMSTPHEHGHEHGHTHSEDHHDHNLRAAYLHVLADTLTSVLAIVALLIGKFCGANWLDPSMGIVGAILIARWSYGLIRDSSQVLLDRQADEHHVTELRASIEGASSDRSRICTFGASATIFTRRRSRLSVMTPKHQINTNHSSHRNLTWSTRRSRYIAVPSTDIGSDSCAYTNRSARIETLVLVVPLHARVSHIDGTVPVARPAC